MLNNQTELETVELTIEEAEKAIAKMDALERLYENADFKLLISTGLMEDEAIRLVKAVAAPSSRNAESQSIISGRIEMISELNMYFQQIQLQGNSSKAALDDHYRTRDEIIEEQQDIVEIGGKA